MRLTEFWSRAIQYISDLPLLFTAVGVLTTTMGGLVFILLIAHLPNILAAALIYMMLILAGLASAIREYYIDSTCK